MIWQLYNAVGGEVPEFRIDSYIQILTLDDRCLSAICMDRVEVVLGASQLREDMSFIHKMRS
jgi:hypothetical protein